jgi:hypothetical protein
MKRSLHDLVEAFLSAERELKNARRSRDILRGYRVRDAETALEIAAVRLARAVVRGGG